MIRSHLIARRAAASLGRSVAPAAASRPLSSAVVDHNRLGAPPSPPTCASLAPAPINPLAAKALRARRLSSAAATDLGSILQREIEEEDGAMSEFSGGRLPPDLAALDAAVRQKWTVLEGISGIGGTGETGSGATVRMFRKEAGSGGAKIGVVFHCQDTEEDIPVDESSLFEDQSEDEEGDEEQAQAVRFGVTVSKGAKTVVLQCRCGAAGDVSVESVVVRDGDAEGVLTALAGGEGMHAALYQGPEFTELAEDLQQSFERYVVEECGVDEGVAAYISMCCDLREQEEYVSWMKTAMDILD